MSGLYNPKVGDRVRFNGAYGQAEKTVGTVLSVVPEDSRHSGSVRVMFDNDVVVTSVHRRSLRLVKRETKA